MAYQIERIAECADGGVTWKKLFYIFHITIKIIIIDLYNSLYKINYALHTCYM